MSEWHRSSAAHQLAAYLRGELERGRWQGKMPGVIRLAGELGVARNSVEAALRQLEKEGLLRNQGKGRSRLIDLAEGGRVQTGFRVAILAYESSDRGAVDTADLLHDLEDAGHMPSIAPRTLCAMGHSVERVAALVKETQADAWVIFSGSREVLEWFATNPLPAFAYAGRAKTVPVASIGPDKITPFGVALRRLIDLGHRRIVMLVRENRRKPEPGFAERFFLEELEKLGVSTGAFNLPDWEESVEGFHAGLESLFRYTPPTALIIDEVPFVVATMQFCLAKGLQVPQDLSLICSDPGPAFDWCHPSISHIDWDYRPVVRRIVRWVNNVSQGKEDRRKGYTRARFVEGGTFGPARMD